MTTNWLTMITATAAILAVGCTPIAFGPPRVSERFVSTRTNSGPTTGVSAEIDQTGSAYSIVVAPNCGTYEVKTKERVTVRDKRVGDTSVMDVPVKGSTVDWTFGIGGVVLAAGGGIVFADSTKVYAHEPTSRTYNSVGPGGAQVIGIGLILAGAALLSVPIVDTVRASGQDETVERIDTKGKPRKTFACKTDRAPGVVLMGRYGKATAKLGVTDAKGEASGDLNEALPQDWLFTGPSLEVVANEEVVGELSLKPVIKKRDEAAWAWSNATACESPKTASDCGGVKQYLFRYPKGAHVKTASETLAKSEATIAKLADEERWASLKGAGCTDATSPPSSIDAGCDRVEQYITDFPSGAHVDEAKKTLAAGRALVKRLREDAAKKAAAAEIAEKKKAEADAAAAAKKEADDEKAAKATERKKCLGMCQMVCSSWQFKKNPGGCYAGCVQNKCE